MKLLNNKMIAILVAIIAIVLSSLYGLSKRPQEQGAVATDIPPSAMVDDSSALPESQTIDKAYELGKSYYEAEEYAKAITQLGKVETSSDFYEDAQMLILKASDSYRTKIMNLADGYIGEGEYTTASHIYEEALVTLPGDQKLVAAQIELSAIVKDSAMQNAAESAKAGDYVSSIRAIQTAIEDLGEDVELNSLLDSYIGEYKQELIEQARATYDSTGYEASVDILQGGMAILGNDEEISTLIQEYRKCAPISFYEMADEESEYYYDGTQSFYYHFDNSWYDTGSNLRENVVSYPFGETSTRLKLDGQFKRASGTLFYYMDEIGLKDRATLKIYGDNTLLSETTVSSDDVAKTFSVDLTGVIFLTVTMKTSWEGNYYPWDYQYAGIADFNLFKNVIE